MSAPEFKIGDRVRLKAKPEVTGVVTATQTPYLVGIHMSDGHWMRRYPEELEAVPMAPEDYVGLKVRFRGGIVVRDVVGVLGGKLLVSSAHGPAFVFFSDVDSVEVVS